jgi:Kef-type K+ transport system membrane component KefB
VRQLEGMVVNFFGPIFCTAAGLKVGLTQLFDPVLVALGLLVITVATLAKLLGGSLDAWLDGLLFWESVAIGSGLNARGSMETIAAPVARSVGLRSR